MAIFNENFIKKFNNEENNIILTEDAIYKNNNDKYCITVDIGQGRESGFLQDPYMKLYNDSDVRRATKLARINLLTGKVVSHEGLPLFKLNSSTIKWLINTLYTKSTNKKYLDMSVYDAIWQFIYDVAKNNNLPHANKLDIDIFINNLKRNN